MRTVDDARVAKFVGERVDRIIYPPFTCMGIESRGEIIAGVVFNCFTGNDVHVTVAGRGWTRGFLADVGHYVFDGLKCQRMTVITEQLPVLHIAQRLGGEIEGLLKNYFGKGRDAFVVGILRETYRF